MIRSEMMARMPATEFDEWMAFSSVEPIGGTRGDVQAAVIAATLANVNRDPKKRSAPYELREFMPTFWGAAKTVKRASTESMVAMVTALNQAFGGKDRRTESKKDEQGS